MLAVSVYRYFDLWYVLIMDGEMRPKWHIAVQYTNQIMGSIIKFNIIYLFEWYNINSQTNPISWLRMLLPDQLDAETIK